MTFLVRRVGGILRDKGVARAGWMENPPLTFGTEKIVVEDGAFSRSAYWAEI